MLILFYVTRLATLSGLVLITPDRARVFEFKSGRVSVFLLPVSLSFIGPIYDLLGSSDSNIV